MKLIAAALIITAVLITIQQFASSICRALPAHADVFGNVRKYKTLTCKVSFLAAGATVQVTALEPYYVRAEQPDGKTWLLDHREGKLILVNPARKTAKIVRSIREEPADLYGTLREFKDVSRHSAEQIGRRRIGQKRAIGFRLTEENGDDEALVWLDPQTQLPIRIEFFAKNQQGQMKQKIVYADIVFDVELDESLFELDLAGYEVEEVVGVPAGSDTSG
jgi:outer membrane lipoprotein-sorting protein